MGDFSVVHGSHERSSGRLVYTTPSEDFKDFISQKEFFDIDSVGNKFTWATRRNNGYIVARLDRVLASQGFLNLWDEADLLILPSLCSDLNPLCLRTTNVVPHPSRPFRFQDMWTMHDSFLPVVKIAGNSLLLHAIPLSGLLLS